MTTIRADIAIIGGSGIYEMDELETESVTRLDTPFGAPSSDVVVGRLDGFAVAFLARHGVGHRLPPHQVPYRANVYALKTLGVHTVIGVNAVGSLHLAIAPGHLALPADLCDRTHGRPSSFFSEGLVAHVSLAEPLCHGVRQALFDATPSVATTVHRGGTLLVVEGPRFSTRAESTLYRSWGMRLIGMTTMPEAALAREAGMCYATVGVVTDYDVWHGAEASVSAEAVMERMAVTVREASQLARAALPALAGRPDCPCRHALETAMATRRDLIDPALAKTLAPILGPSVNAATGMGA